MTDHAFFPNRFGLACLLTVLTAGLSQAENGSLVRPSGYSLGAAVEAQNSRHPLDNESVLREQPAPNDAAAGTSSLAIPLKGSTSGSNNGPARSSFASITSSLGTTVGALAVTLGLFAVLIAFTRRVQKNQTSRRLPREAFEVVGETEIGPKQKLLVVRCGLQALIVGVSPAGIQPVAQIDDPDEAGQFIAQCRGLGSAAVFSSTLKEIEKEATRSGFVEDSSTPKSKGRLFLRA